jgi:glycogen debranching enzyme
VILLDEYERWTGDRAIVRELEIEARAALAWIDEYADIPGDTGYIWYKRRNEKTGLENQCWKDSWDSISYRDGSLPEFPRATCELQGYAYDAKVRGARLAREIWKDPELAAKARSGRRPTSSGDSTATTGWRTASTSRSLSILTAGRWTRSDRTTGTCSGAASSTRRRRRR